VEEVLEKANLKEALKRVKANKGSAGMDGMTVQNLPRYLMKHWPEHRDQLLNGCCWSLTRGFGGDFAVSSGFNGRRGVDDSTNFTAGAWNGNWRLTPLEAITAHGA